MRIRPLTLLAAATFVLCGALLMNPLPTFAEEVAEFKLDNGLLVLLKENHNAPVVNVNIVYRVGSKYERPGLTGLSHMLEHMMFKTTKNLPLGEFDKRLKSVGADNNAFTWLDQTVYHETIAADKVDVALALEAERMRGLLCLADDQALEMPVVRNELEQRDDSPFTLLYEELASFAFQAHPYRTPTIGWKDDVEHITADDIKAYYDEFYQPDNAFICAVGDFDTQQMLALIKQHFGPLPAAGVKKPRITTEPPQLGERRFEIRRAGQMDFVLTGWHIPESEHPDSYALVVLANILGQGRTSRMYKALVDSGKCASADAWSSNFGYAEPFLFFTALTLNPGVDPAEAEPLTYQEIGSIIDDGVTEEELNRAKKQARVSFIYDKDSVEQEAESILDFELMSSWRDLDKYLPGIEAVTGADVQRVAAQYLTQDNRTVGVYHAIRPEGGDAPGGVDEGEDDGEYMDEGATFDPQPRPHYRDGGYSPVGRTAVSASFGSRTEPSAPLSTNAALADAGDQPYAATFTLDNGLTVAIRENHNNATVNVSGIVRAGSIYDPPGKRGVGSFAVQMLSNGTQKHSKLELAQIVENAGIDLGFGPSRENFSFSGRSLTEDFPLLLEMLSEQLLTPSFPADEVEKMRQQIQAGLLNSLNDTFDQSFYTARELIYGADSPFAGRVEGTPESVKAITRDDLAGWYKANVVAGGAVLVIVGDVDTAAALDMVKQRFSGWPAGSADRGAVLEQGTNFLSVAGARRDVEIPDKSNASLLFVGPGPSKLGPEFAARSVADFIFGGDFYSRLNERLRVKEGLTYGSFAWFSNGRAAGPFCINIQVNPENIAPAVKDTLEEVQRIYDGGITDDELTLSKDYLTGNFPVRLATNGAVAGAIADALYLDRGVSYIQHYQQMIQAVTKEQVEGAVRQFIDPAPLGLVVAGSLPETAAEAPAGGS